MNGIELFQLGRLLMRIGQNASPNSGIVTFPEDGRMILDLPASVRLIVSDAFENPDSSIGEITARTGLPQSHVSASVARLRDAGILVVSADPKDRRRTLVRVDFQQRAEQITSGTVDDAVAAALATDDPGEVKEIVSMLEALAARLLPNSPAGR
jgi:DNA-binding MarR family transcriptional regulator